MSTVHTNSSEQIFLDYYSKLNAAQKEAVDTVLGPVMVIAGPGTGKTQILAMRIANILRNPDLQASPSNILCLTFTESAVTAMRNRLIEIIGSEAYYVRIHTFHSFCNDVIKENPAKFLAVNSISDLEQIQILNSIIDKLDANSAIKPFGDPYLYRGDIAKHIQTLKRESISVTRLREAIVAIESFINKNRDLIEDFISRHARTIKEEDCDLFVERLFIANQESEFIPLIQDFRDRSEKISEFKSMIKDFYEKNLREIPKQKELAKVYEAYEEKLKINKLYDFEDMILRVIKQFENDADLRARYQEQFQYILIDEYQDTNGSQNKILELLTLDPYGQNSSNIFVVGDDDQSIYRFQGASLENIIYFYKRYQTNLKLIVLDQNYRSQQKILNLAHLSIDANAARISKLIPNINKRLKSSGSAADYHLAEIEILKSINHEDEIYNLARTIRDLIESGVRPSEIAVLFRENKEAYDIAEALARLGLRAKLEAGDNILEDIHIAQLIDLLRVISKPESYSSLLFNVLNYDFILESEDFRLAEITMRDVYSAGSLRFGSANSKPMIELLLEHPKFSIWAHKIIKVKQESYNFKFDDLLEKVIKDFGFLDFCLRQADYVTKINKLNSLFKEINSFSQSPLREGYNPNLAVKFNLEGFIKHIELLQENGLKIRSQPISLAENAVRLMTAHKSKGLEFEHVFIHACRDKHWGNKTNRSKLKLPPRLLAETESLVHGDPNEDERRLFYVAMTRAKYKLYISYHIKNTRDQDIVPSLFLSELISNSETKIIDFTYGSSLERESSAKLEMRFLTRDDFSINKESEYIDSLLENYRMSITHLNNYLECPRKFFYQNLLRVPSAKNKHACFGTAVHEALFDLFTSLRHTESRRESVISRSEATWQSSSSDNLNYLLERFEHHLLEENLPEQEYNDALAVGKLVLAKYFEHYINSFNLNTELEYDFSSLGLNLDGIELTGKLDKIEKLDHPQINVIDYKTGNPASKTEALKRGGDYYRQIVFYQLLCDLARKSGQFPYQMISGEIDFVQQDSYGKFHKKKFQVSDEDLEQVKSEIQAMYSDIKAHNFDKTEDLDSCRDCSFKNICGR